jgi:23S rRNA (uracil1939-C5)-methyltransferase
LQHLDAEAYQHAKLSALRTALGRVRIEAEVLAPLCRVAPARRRARVGLMRPCNPRKSGKIGFRERFSRDVVDLEECLVLEPPLLATVGALRDRITELLPPAGRAEASLTRTDSGIDMLLTAPLKPSLGALEALAALAVERDLARVVWRSPGGETPIVERRPVIVMRSAARVAFPPGAFLQATANAEAVLVEEVMTAIGRRRPVLDLYAGLGTFGFALAGAGEVHMVEGDERTASAAAAAARHMTISVERRDLARDPLPTQTLARYAAAVFDPPRAGAAPQVETLARSGIDTVVAVSCNPATFARDAARLIAGGYHLTRIVPIDQFVWSPHLELVGVFRR